MHNASGWPPARTAAEPHLDGAAKVAPGGPVHHRALRHGARLSTAASQTRAASQTCAAPWWVAQTQHLSLAAAGRRRSAVHGRHAERRQGAHVKAGELGGPASLAPVQARPAVSHEHGHHLLQPAALSAVHVRQGNKAPRHGHRPGAASVCGCARHQVHASQASWHAVELQRSCQASALQEVRGPGACLEGLVDDPGGPGQVVLDVEVDARAALQVLDASAGRSTIRCCAAWQAGSKRMQTPLAGVHLRSAAPLCRALSAGLCALGSRRLGGWPARTFTAKG